MKRTALFLFTMMMVTNASFVHAEERPIDEGYVTASGNKLMRGITNMVLGFVIEPFAEAERVNEAHYVKSGGMSSIPVYFSGVPRGIAKGLQRFFVGIYEVATFYVPQDTIIEPPLILEDKHFDTRPHLRAISREKTFEYEDLERKPIYL